MSLFAGTTNGVFLSSDNGANWAQANSGLSDTVVNGLAISVRNIFACINNGIWWRPLSEMITSVERLTYELPTHFNLDQNYPNPFNPGTMIRYSIPTQSKLLIKVYDVLGNEIATLMDEEKSVGAYELTWNAAQLPSGVYFYQLRATPNGGQAGNFVQTRKMILIK
jgi:hypothetical protein